MKVSAILVLVVAALSAIGCGGKSEPSNVLRVGMELSYPPFETKDEKGRPAGIGYEMANALAESMGKELVVESIEFSGLITALKTGKVDLVVSSMTATEERAKSIDFSDPYVSTGLAVLINKRSVVNTVEDLKKPGVKVAVKNGTTGQAYVTKYLPEAEVTVLEEDGICALEVSQGKADIFIYDQLAVFRFHSRYKDSTRAILKPIQAENWAVGIQKGNDELRENVNAFLKQFRAEGGFDRLAEKFLSKEKAMLEEMEVPFIF